MRKSYKITTILVASLVLCLLLAQLTWAASVGTKVLRGAAIGYAVRQFADPLNGFINKVTLRNGVNTRLATKVVPILSVGEKGYVGGAQVAGPKELVRQVDAVFQYEKNFSSNNYRVKALVPSASLNPLKLERVPKVGVSAIIDVALAGGLKYHTVGTGIQAGDVIRGTAVLVAVKNTGQTLNKFVNTITLNKGVATKVVPMGSIGEKAYLGAAQISGSSNTIRIANAVWQYEDLFSNGRFRVKILVPTTSSNPLKMKRVDGAGVSAVIDMALSQQKELMGRDQESRPLGGILRTGADDERHDRGLHKGWYIGKHKGWEKK